MRKEQITVTNNSVCANISSACPQQKNIKFIKAL